MGRRHRSLIAVLLAALGLHVAQRARRRASVPQSASAPPVGPPPVPLPAPVAAPLVAAPLVAAPLAADEREPAGESVAERSGDGAEDGAEDGSLDDAQPRSLVLSLPAALALGVGALVLGGVVLVLVQLALGLRPERPLSPSDQQAALRQVGRGGTIDVTGIYARVSPSIVIVESTEGGSVQAAPDGEFQGTGFVVEQGGHQYILTNYHVVQGAEQVHVVLADGRRLVAKVRGLDPSIDLAVLDPGAHVGQALTLDPSHTLKVGEPVMALGNPLGLARSASSGIVSALDRQLRAPNDFTIDGVIETDLALDHGSSGGPLLDAAGNVVGMTTAIASSSARFGFAVPSDLISHALPSLARGARPQYAYLGVKMIDITPGLASALKLPSTDGGAEVVDVTAGGPAAEADLQGTSRSVSYAGQKFAVGGDIIVDVDDQPVHGYSDVSQAIALHRPGDVVRLTLWRGGQLKTVPVTLGVRPAKSG